MKPAGYEQAERAGEEGEKEVKVQLASHTHVHLVLPALCVQAAFPFCLVLLLGFPCWRAWPNCCCVQAEIAAAGWETR